jgi:hypothetical protein
MKQLATVAVLGCVALSLLTEDASGCRRRRRAQECTCVTKPIPYNATIGTCSCNSASGVINLPATTLIECYVTDATNHVFDGMANLNVSPGAWSTTFASGTKTPPCTVTIVADDGKPTVKICPTHQYRDPVQITSCHPESATGTLGSAKKLRGVVVWRENKHLKSLPAQFEYPGNGTWNAKPIGGSPSAPVVWTVIAVDHTSAAAKYCPN